MKDELAKRLVQGLKDAGINFVTYLPETRLSQIVPLIRDDPAMELIAAASEQEAVTIAERYSGIRSAKFVNGVLDALARRMGRM